MRALPPAYATSAAAILLLAVSAAQVSPSSPQAQAESSGTEIATIRSSSRLVNIDVVVTDREGHPVTGLTAEDFQVFDKDSQQRIAVFSSRKAMGLGNESRPLGQGEFTNDAQRVGRATEGTTIILFDTLNSAYFAQAYALEKIKILLRQLRPDDHVGIDVLHEDGLKVVYKPNQPASVLLEAMQQYDAKQGNRSRDKGSQQVPGTGLADLDRFLRGKENREPARHCDPERVAFTIAAFQDIARSTSGLGGRKSIIWVSEHALSFYSSENGVDFARMRGCGMELDPDLMLEEPNLAPYQEGLSHPLMAGSASAIPRLNAASEKTRVLQDRRLTENDELDMLLRLLTKNNIILYPVSAEGLQAVRLFGEGGMDYSGRMPTMGPGELTEATMRSVDDVANVEAHQQMSDLAQRSGGRAFYNRNDLETGIRRALDDSNNGYALAYYPDHNKWNGDWRKIRVTVNRPDVKVLARGGYYAFPQAKLLPPKARKQMLEEIAASPLEDTEIAFTVRMTPPPGGEPSSSVDARVFLGAQKLFNNQMGTERWKSSFEILFFQLSPKNTILDVTTQNLDLDMDQAKHAEAVRRGINTLEKLTLKPGASLLYVIVHDKNTDAVGSVRVPLEQYAKAMPSSAEQH